MTGTATHRPLLEPLSTGASWLIRALAVSVVFHILTAVAWWLIVRPSTKEVELVDIELAPPPPKAEALPAEVARPPEAAQAAQATQTDEPDLPPEQAMALGDAGV